MNARLESTQPAAAAVDAEQSIGQIAVQLPGATAVFRRLKLDFCCGGQVSLRQATADKNLHRDNPHVPAGLADTLEGMEQELLSHMEKEEQILFPMLKSGGNPFVKHPISMMRSEHVGHGAELDKLLALTNDATPPQGACNTWRALYAGIAQLNDDLINHIHLENNVLFPQFEAPAPAQGCGSSGCGCS